MAGEVQVPIASKPTTAYFTVQNGTGQYWYTVTPAFEAYNAAHWTSYAIALTQTGSTDTYSGTFPSGIGIGDYKAMARIQAGGSPAVTDLYVAGDNHFQWGGSVITPPIQTTGAGAVGVVVTTTTTTNLTNAPTNGDFTAAMKTSLNAATPASVVGAVGSVTGAVGSVTGNVGGNVNGNVAGSVGSVTGNVGGSTASVTGDVGGKIIGGGVGTITGSGVQASSVVGSVGSVVGAVGSVTGAVGSVTGSVGSVVGSVGGNVTGDVSGKVLGGGASSITGDGVRAASVTGAVGSVTGAVGSVTGLTTSTISAAILATPANKLATNADGSVNSTASGNVTVGGYATGQDPATLVLDAMAASHNTTGTIGAKINAAGGAADPLNNAVPGSYAAGTAGYVIGNMPTEVATALGSNPITVVSPLSTDGGTLTLVQGDDYYNADGRAISFTITGTFSDWTGGTATLRLACNGVQATVTGTIVTGTGSTRVVRFDVPKSSLASIKGNGKFQVSVALATSLHATTPVAVGDLVVVAKVA